MSLIITVILGCFLLGLLIYSFYIVLFSKDSKSPAENISKKSHKPDNLNNSRTP